MQPRNDSDERHIDRRRPIDQHGRRRRCRREGAGRARPLAQLDALRSARELESVCVRVCCTQLGCARKRSLHTCSTRAECAAGMSSSSV